MLKEKAFIFFWRRPPPPLFMGGAEITQNDLAMELAKAEAKVLYVGSLATPNYPEDGKEAYYRSCLAADDRVVNVQDSGGKLNYEYRGIKCLAVPQLDIDDVLTQVLSTYSDAYFISSQENSDELIARAKKSGLKTLGWLHSASDVGMQVLKGKPDHVLSTSQYIASLARERLGSDSQVFYPSFADSQEYMGTSGEYITFVNPVPAKGSDFFLDIALRLPDRKFLAVEGWYKNEDFLKKMPSNVTYLPPQQDMGAVWSQTRLLLVPSKVEEAFGRVVVEAGLRGIPSIVSDKGGLHEALNNSGKSITYGNLEAWLHGILEYDNDKIYCKERQKSLQAARFFKNDVTERFKKIIIPLKTGTVAPELNFP